VTASIFLIRSVPIPDASVEHDGWKVVIVAGFIGDGIRIIFETIGIVAILSLEIIDAVAGILDLAESYHCVCGAVPAHTGGIIWSCSSLVA